MRTDPGWLIHQLEVRICFWSSAAWPPTFLYLSFSTLNSSSLWRTDTIVFAKLVKPPVSIKPPLKFIYQGFADISSSREWFEVTAAVHKPNWTQIKDLQQIQVFEFNSILGLIQNVMILDMTTGLKARLTELNQVQNWTTTNIYRSEWTTIIFKEDMIVAGVIAI